ncbi:MULTISPECIES: SulP family inorganic anion transporter [Rhodococcus]|uniref:SulP family inorganic anion transporter n=2 Tax=Rhodococcus opacus TaxID=37919 RepID=A0AAX3YFB5_RHOOP|nr:MULTISPECIES: SulP family inorganic anion transporter [Rhodococcus]ELB94086.1 sulfate transporter [Rhodococcus wratislaviensis IFP 2016]EID78648.1 sulfate transporter [Rhodococcus opacus RKJ300 = JCM 13270]MBA8958125.1 high affinity sulfate transporter 1 [Rhodococcus opacus]MBP2203690.1 high affinity sulfate transporter 1 [Rhodococcus opacus]MCZ4583871.1 SulP family inorganic anion transporter [Rhodococcus opacus]
MVSSATGTWPVFGSLQEYRKGWVRPDVIAGLTVWAVLVPEALAYATIAGVPPVVGLYAAIPALILYAAAGSSRHLVVGPMSATAALSAAIVAPLAGADGGKYAALTAVLAIATGIAGLLAGLLRLGFIASFISEPVLKGFIVGLALTIIIGQVPALFGVEKEHGNFFEQAWGVVTHLGDIDWGTLAVGVLSLVVVLGFKRWLPLVPGSLLAVLLGIAAVAVFGLDGRGVDIVGHIDSGLPSVGLPDGVGFDDYIDLLGPAVGVLLIGFAEGLGAAKTYAAKEGYEVDANRELLGLGTANLGSGLCSGMVVNGSLSKTAVNGGAGAKSQVSGLVVAVLTVVTLLFLTGLFEKLPEATLAAVVIAAVIELVDISALRRLYGVWTERLGSIYGYAARADFAAALAAMVGVLLFDTLPGLVIGIGVSMLLLLYRASRPHVAALAKEGSLWVDAERHPDLPTTPHVVVVRVEAGLFFANADHVKDRIEDLCTDDTRVVVLDAETSPFIDVSAAQMLVQLRDVLARRGIELRVARDIGQFRDAIRHSGSDSTPVDLYPTVREALAEPDRQ